MKKLLSLLFLGCLVASTLAQTASSPLVLTGGEAKAFGGTTADSLLAGDTLTYYFQLKTPDAVDGITQLFYDETAGSQTTLIKIYGANENRETMYVQLKKGVLQSDWQSASLTADANVFFDSEVDTVAFNRRFIKIQAISSGASSKGTLRGVMKTYIRK